MASIFNSQVTIPFSSGHATPLICPFTAGYFEVAIQTRRINFQMILQGVTNGG